MTLKERLRKLVRKEHSAVASPRRVKSRFKTLEEWDARVNANCGPRRADDTPVIIGAPPDPQTGRPKRATPTELIAFVNEHRARHGWPPYDPAETHPARHPIP